MLRLSSEHSFFYTDTKDLFFFCKKNVFSCKKVLYLQPIKLNRKTLVIWQSTYKKDNA